MANKKQRNLIIGIIIIILLIGVLGYYSDFPFAIGFSTLSLGQQTFTSNDPIIGGQAWLLTVSQNGAGQFASGTFIAKDSSGATSDSFTIKTSIDKNTATYPIYNQNIPISRVDYTITIYNPFGSLKGCNPDVWTNYFKDSFSLNVYCYKFITDGYYGSVGSANVNFESSINVQSSPGNDKCVVSNTGATSCISSNGNVQVSWVGSLVSGQSPPQPTDQNIIAVYNTNKGGWITSKSQYFTDWNNAKNNLVNCLGDFKTQCFNDFNNF